MDYAAVLALINQWIVANGNNEITANVLRPILEAMLQQPNDLIGDLDLLETTDQTDLVAAINSLVDSSAQTPLTLLNQHTESQTTGDTGINLLQPDFGAAIFTVADMQEGSVYQGSFQLKINNNDTNEEKTVSLFGIEIPIKTAIPVIDGKMTFKISFYNQVGDDISYKVSYELISSGLILIGNETDTIDNTNFAPIELSVNSVVADEIFINEAKIQRC